MTGTTTKEVWSLYLLVCLLSHVLSVACERYGGGATGKINDFKTLLVKIADKKTDKCLSVFNLVVITINTLFI